MGWVRVMKILNVRNGFACNSSSTHSIIFTDGALDDVDCFGGDFGWQRFTAASEQAKKSWLAATVRKNVEELEQDADYARMLLKELDLPIEEGTYVDHQSCLHLPRSWNGKNIDVHFVRDFQRYLLDPRAIVFGGNDNEEDCDVPVGQRVFYRDLLPTDTWQNAQYVARKDSGGYWALFDRCTGHRVRVALEECLAIEAKRADAPELVDLKITDYCTYDCPTCYQGSTSRGEHAGQYCVYDVLDQLAEVRCFEVAIGGGEPTLHPHFEDIVRYARRVGIVPNFTTRDLKWFARYPDLADIVGGYAVSCDDAKSVRRVLKALAALPGPARDVLKSKLTVQHILGLVDEHSVRDLLAVCGEAHVPVVLLGYKTTHRGANATPKVPSKGTWGAWLKKQCEGGERLGVDTVLANELRGLVDSRRLTTREGQFSGYIDAVTLTLRPSSFGTHTPIRFRSSSSSDTTYPSLREAWQSMTSYEPESAYVYKRRLA